MENWLYNLKEIWLLHKTSIKRYGTCVACMLSGLYKHSQILLWAGFAAIFVIYAAQRWGEKYAERGRQWIKGSDSKDQE